MGTQMVVRLPALCASGHPLTPERFMVLISVRGQVDSTAMVQLEGLSQLKNPMTSGIKPVTFQLVAQCLNQLRYCMPHDYSCFIQINEEPPVDECDLDANNCGNSN
jgi:hypothetical protein